MRDGFKKKAQASPLIAEGEWNFDAKSLPDEEVTACFYYEFSREFAKSSPQWSQLALKKNERWTMERSEKLLELFNHLPVNSYLFSVADFVQTPWLTLDGKHKDRYVSQLNDRLRTPNFQSSIPLLITLERDLPEYRDAGVSDFESWRLLDACSHPPDKYQREQGFIAINWNHTDTELIAKFKQWLAEERGTREAVNSGRGQNKKRQELKALGAVRLLSSGLTAKDAMNESERVTGKPLFENERSWSQAKTTDVPRILQRLFPQWPVKK